MRARLALALALVLLPSLRLAAADTAAVPGWLGRLVSWATGGQVRTAGLSVSLGGAIKADRVEIEDKNGVWLTITGFALDMVPRRLFSRELRIDRLDVEHVTLVRMPVSSGGSSSLPLHLVLTKGHIARIDVDASVAGQAIALALDASADLPSMQQASFDVAARPIDGGGNYHLAGSFDDKSVQVRIDAGEPEGGLIARLAGLHDVGALSVMGSAEGPLENLATNFSASAGNLRLTEAGRVNLNDRSGDVEVTAAVPAMTPVAGVAWGSAALNAHVSGSVAQPHGSGTLSIDALQAEGASVGRLVAEVNGDLGHIATRATLNGVQVLGPVQVLFAAAPVTVNADVGFKADRPEQMTASVGVVAGDLHVSGSGQVDIKNRSGDVDLTASVPAMSPVAGVAWQSASLRAHVTGSMAQPGSTGTISIENFVAQGATVERLDAEVSGNFEHFTTRATLTGLHTPGPRQDLFAAAPMMMSVDADLSAPGRPVRVSISHPMLDATAIARTAGDIGGDLTLRVNDVAALVPAVRGALTIQGHLAGPMDDLSLQADASGELATGGLPAAAVTASLQAHRISGNPTGELKASATQANNRVTLNAALDDRGLARLRLVADAAGARANVAGDFDLNSKLLALNELTANWHDQRIALVAPARISVANGINIERLRLGLRQATLDVSGRAAPALDLTAALRNLPAALADDFVPGLGAEGTLNAEVRLNGTPARPSGTIRVVGSGLRLKNGAAAPLPAASVTANATLAGDRARVDANATVGSARLSVSGSAPLTATAPLALRTSGTIDLGLFNRVLAASGTTVRGRATIDATIDGNLAAPRVQGTLRIAGGEVQDVVHGVHLQAIDAALRTVGDELRIERLSARAGNGTIGVSGSIGLAAPLPVDITVTAHNARPIASNLITAELDADLTLRGAVLNGMAVGGGVTLDHTEITVPERLPSSVAALNIVNARSPPPPPPVFSFDKVGLDLTVQAPSRVFVRGRGLDAEFTGQIHLGGTGAAPRPVGRLRMRRGTFDLVGKTLTFSSGTIGLDGSGRLDPTLDFTATNFSGNTTSTLTVSGYASDPKFALTSVPPLPQDEVLSHLLFGRSTSGLGVFQLAGIASGIAQLTGIGGDGLNPLGKVRSALGLSYLSVGGQGSGTGVAAGREIANGVTVGARQSISGQGAQATMQIELGRGFQLETALGTAGSSATTTGDPGGSSVGINWQFQY